MPFPEPENFHFSRVMGKFKQNKWMVIFNIQIANPYIPFISHFHPHHTTRQSFSQSVSKCHHPVEWKIILHQFYFVIPHNNYTSLSLLLLVHHIPKHCFAGSVWLVGQGMAEIFNDASL